MPYCREPGRSSALPGCPHPPERALGLRGDRFEVRRLPRTDPPVETPNQECRYGIEQNRWAFG